MCNTLRWLIAPFVALAFAVQAEASVINLFSTGVNASGTPLPGGALDPHWTIIAGPGLTAPQPGVVATDQSASGRHVQSSASAWIWVNAKRDGRD